jgi:tetratricopeptide (TPR) repeat protein
VRRRSAAQCHQDGRFEGCIKAAQRAIQVKPNYPEAYHNIAAAYRSIQQWDLAIRSGPRGSETKA